MNSRLVSSCLIIIAIIIVLAIIVGLFLTFGQGGSFLSTSKNNIGATAIIENNTPRPLSLDNAFVQVQGKHKYFNSIPDSKIFSITGLNLDNEGKADVWLFIVRQGNNTKFLEINNSGVRENTWYGSVPDKEIIQAKIMSPEDIFKKYQSRLNRYSEEKWNFKNLELKNSNYTLNMQKGLDSKIFIFNAGNGDIILG
jgi:hypothetical protein